MGDMAGSVPSVPVTPRGMQSMLVPSPLSNEAVWAVLGLSPARAVMLKVTAVDDMPAKGVLGVSVRGATTCSAR